MEASLPEYQELLCRLFRRQRLAVLSTHGGGRPYASVVAFAASPDLRSLVFSTTRATQKYANLQAEPYAAMLIDNRTNRGSDFQRAVAVTAVGRVDEAAGPDQERLREILIRKHPGLREFTASPTCAVLVLAVERFFVVRRFQNVVEIPTVP